MKEKIKKVTLAMANSKLCDEWHTIKNGKLTPQDVTPYSKLKVWWICESGHEWQAQISNRMSGAGCPYCSGRKAIAGKTDLATISPQLAEEWHPTKNISVRVCDVTANSNKKVWWLCKNGHEWEAQINSRNKNGCPYCGGKKVLQGYNDIATTHPELLQEWNYEKNENLLPTQVSKGYDKKVWWLCNNGHEWQAPIYNRIKGHGCPICAKGTQTSFAEQAIYFYIKKDFPDAINSDRRFKKELDIFVPSKAFAIEYDGYMWHKGKREFESDIAKNEICKENGIMLYRFREEGCPQMDDEQGCLKIISCKYNDVEILTNAIEHLLKVLGSNQVVDLQKDRIKILEQFAMHKKDNNIAKHSKLAREWHPTKNGKIKLETVSLGTNQKYWWMCENGHEWQASVSNRNKGKGCPYCSGKKVINGETDLATLNPQLAEEWHPTKNINIKVCDVTVNSNKKVWWLCKNGHEWQAQVSSRNSGRGCPFCAGKKVWVGYNDLQTVNPIIASEWHPTRNGELKVTMVTKGSHKKVWWMCKNGHEWQAEVKSRLNGSGCPICHKTK